MANPNVRPLGQTQVSVLGSLIQHGGWEPMCGWLWDTQANTAKILNTLVRRGLVTKTGRAYRASAAGVAEITRRQA